MAGAVLLRFFGRPGPAQGPGGLREAHVRPRRQVAALAGHPSHLPRTPPSCRSHSLESTHRTRTHCRTHTHTQAKAQLKQDKGKRAALRREAPKPLVPRQLQSPSLLDFHPLEVARQLALIDWELFAAIPHQEFVAKAWDNPASSPVSQKWFNYYEQVRGLVLGFATCS